MMTRDDEDIIRGLCMRAAVLIEGTASMARWPHESTDDLIEIVETMKGRMEVAAKLAAAALALTDI